MKKKSKQCTSTIGKNKRTVIRGLSAALLCSVMLSGCNVQQTENENLVILEPEAEEIKYSLTVASVGDVIQTKKVRCDYEQLKGVDVYFPTSGKIIKEIHVKAGDTVTKGQLIAELDIGDVDTKIRDLEYKIAKNTLLLKHLDENENDDISSKWLEYIYESEHSDEKDEELKESISKLQQKNEYSREDYQDAIAVDTLELEKIRKDIKESFLYAEMDGTVSYAKTDIEGTISKADERIISIMGGADGIFVVKEPEYARYFKEGEEVELTVITGIGAGGYKLVPYKMDEWEDKLLFTFPEGEEVAVTKTGYAGTIKIITGMKEQVLNVPVKSVHVADGKEYVYILGEGNVRDVKWIETGLYGDEYVEVVSGLTEGEKVILK